MTYDLIKKTKKERNTLLTFPVKPLKCRHAILSKLSKYSLQAGI